MKPCVLGFYGESNTGKTMLIVDLIKRLIDDGFKVATIKKSDKEIKLDSPGKDTFRHSEAGAGLTALSSKNETDFIIKKNLKTIDIISVISQIEQFDFIFVESSTDESIPKIRIGAISKRKNTIFDYDNDFEKLYSWIKNKELKGE